MSEYVGERRVYKIGPDYYVARSSEDAYELYCRTCDIEPGEPGYETLGDVELCEPGETIVIHDESKKAEDCADGLTFAQWAHHSPIGLLCSEEW